MPVGRAGESDTACVRTSAQDLPHRVQRQSAADRAVAAPGRAVSPDLSSFEEALLFALNHAGLADQPEAAAA